MNNIIIIILRIPRLKHGKYVRQCCQCRKILNFLGQWISPGTLSKHSHVTHGYCPTCSQALINTLQPHHHTTKGAGK